MFRTGSPYSPFFTSGLLYESPAPRRGSLPADSSAFYFTLHSSSDDRSFLSLDLAESQSLRCKARKVFTFAQIPATPPHTPLRLRRSRDSLRTIPSPKPAPSMTLPDLPSTPPRLPVSPSLRLSLEHTSHSAPARDSISSVSPTVRKINRSHALARLEGRTNSTRRKAQPIKRNFMNMSDEESEDDEDDGRKLALDVINEPEDLVLPPPMPLPLPGRKSTSPRKPQTVTKDWFPLKSFIDLQAADENPTAKFSWRSFIEVARVS